MRHKTAVARSRRLTAATPGNATTISAGARLSLAHPKPLFMLNPLPPCACCCDDRHDNLSAADDGIAHEGNATKAFVEATAAAAHASESNVPCMILLLKLLCKGTRNGTRLAAGGAAEHITAKIMGM